MKIFCKEKYNEGINMLIETLKNIYNSTTMNTKIIEYAIKDTTKWRNFELERLINGMLVRIGFLSNKDNESTKKTTPKKKINLNDTICCSSNKEWRA